MADETSQRRLHLWSGLIVLGVFLCGAAAGAGIFAWLRPGPMRAHRPHGWLPVDFGELELTAEQQVKANAILQKRRETVEAAIKQTFPQVRAAEIQMEREMRAILTEPQAKKFDEILARRPPPHQMMERHPPLGGIPMPPGGPRLGRPAALPEPPPSGVPPDAPAPPARPSR